MYYQKGIPRGSAKYKTFLLLHITVQFVPGYSDFDLFTALKIVFGILGGKMLANTPRIFFSDVYNCEFDHAADFNSFLDCRK